MIVLFKFGYVENFYAQHPRYFSGTRHARETVMSMQADEEGEYRCSCSINKQMKYIHKGRFLCCDSCYRIWGFR